MLATFLRRSSDVAFVCSAPIDEVWIRSTALACRGGGMRVAVDICAGRAPDAVAAIYREAGIALTHGVSLGEAARRRCAVAVTASSGLNRTIYPTRARTFVHMPHSLASLHMIYPPDAFDGYDALLAAGPHHEREFAALSAAHGLGERPSRPAGYGKLDLLADAAASHAPEPRHVLIAPSWGPDNLLDRLGVLLAAALAAKGWTVTVRPHPLFVIERAPVMDRLRALADAEPRVTIESPLETDDAIFRASVLVGDYSGIGFEFAALRRRPVVSVDVGLKIVNPDWQTLGLTPVEIACRSRLGPVVPPEVSAIVGAVESCNAETRTDAPDVRDFLHGEPGTCGARASRMLADLGGAP